MIKVQNTRNKLLEYFDAQLHYSLGVKGEGGGGLVEFPTLILNIKKFLNIETNATNLCEFSYIYMAAI